MIVYSPEIETSAVSSGPGGVSGPIWSLIVVVTLLAVSETSIASKLLSATFASVIETTKSSAPSANASSIVSIVKVALSEPAAIVTVAVYVISSSSAVVYV